MAGKKASPAKETEKIKCDKIAASRGQITKSGLLKTKSRNTTLTVMIKKIIAQIKSVNKYGVVAVLIATSLVAFKPAKPKHTDGKFTVAWFQYNGGTVSSPSSYSILDGEPECNSTGALCAIQGNENGTTGLPTQASVNAPMATRKHDPAK